MANLFGGLWNWVTGNPQMPDLQPNLFFERDANSGNNFWISCIFDPTLEIKYVNGVVTRIMDTDKCVIDDKYHYQPKTEKEISNFPYIEVNSSVRISIYRKKNSNDEWRVASCFLTREGSCHQVVRESNDLAEFTFDEPAIQIEESIKDLKIKNNDTEDMSVEVLGDMPKTVNFENESTIQILFRNNSYTKEHELLDYQIMQGNKSQLSIINKAKFPTKVGPQSQYIFDINLKGKFLGRSTEKVEFIFKDIKYKVGINISVTDSRMILPLNLVPYVRKEIDLQRLLELQNDTLVPGVRFGKKVQFKTVRIGNWNIPNQLIKCYWTEKGKNNCNIEEIQEKIAKLYPAVFEVLTYKNYRAKFHSLLFIDEIEHNIALQKYAKERMNFEKNGEYLVLNIDGLSESRSSLIPGDRIAVTDPPLCEKRLGDHPGRYEGIIHKIMADKILLKFDPEFHQICGHWEYSVSFFSSRNILRKQHEVINELWKKNRLGEAFLMPYKDVIQYKTPKIAFVSLGDVTDIKNNLSSKNKSLLAPPKVINKIRWFNEKLNFQQKSAVINILKGEARPMPYVIYGPPGTGKTVTLTECIIQVYKEFPKSKLLICAPSNSAVDILLEKLVTTGLFNKTIMRRLTSYTYYISNSYNPEFEEYFCLPEMDSSFGEVELENIDLKMIKKRDILNLRVVITTEGAASMLYMMGLKSGTFSHIFVDEAGQTTEPEILLPLTLLDPYRDGQVVLAGDPKQLGPVVMSRIANHHGLEQSMLARFINYPLYLSDPNLFPEYNGFNPKVITHLIENYRSLPEIVHSFSKFFYNSLLQPTKIGNSVHERVFLNNLNDNVHWDIECKGPIVVHGIVGEDFRDPSSPSWFNPHEAFQVLLYVTKLMKSGLLANDIGIITPYLAQVSKINELMKMYFPDTILPKVGTVEMFQGQERMVIILSLVRSKSEKGREEDQKFHLGFLISKERVNVALSRAKSLLVIIGDPSTLQRVYEWKCILKGAIKSNNYVGCNIPGQYEPLNTITTL